MSLYGEYIKERTADFIFESAHGFVTFRYLNDGKSVYIIDIFTQKNHRTSGAASALADLVVEEARTKGCMELLGTVSPSTKNSTISLKVLFGYGMELHSSGPDWIICRKDI